MDNITGKSVIGEDYLISRLYLVEELKHLAKKTSVIIDAPRRFGKTSIVKELISEEDRKKDKDKEFNILYFELEGEETINGFCHTFFKELLNLYRIRKQLDILKKLIGDSWNSIANRTPKITCPEFSLELKEKTRSYDFQQWKEKISSLVYGLNHLEKKTIIVFDEFPDMLMNIKNKSKDELDCKQKTDSLLSWLRELRQKTQHKNKCQFQFVFCGSINLRKTLEDMGIGKRINDLETLRVPPMKNDESVLLINTLMKKYEINIEADAIDFMVSKITDGSPYYGQIFFKALRDSRENNFFLKKIKGIYDSMLRGGDHDLNHFHSRLNDYLTPIERECSDIILKHLCANTLHEKELYDIYLLDKCKYEVFQSVINRLVYEGYIMRDTNDNGRIRFVSPLIKDWWACKAGM